MSFLGSAIASAGDVNGDGTDDLILGSRRYPGSGFVLRGAAYLFHGPLTTDVRASCADEVFIGFGADHLGTSVAGAGDVTGDGVDDVIIGDDLAGEGPGGPGAGGVYIFGLD